MEGPPPISNKKESNETNPKERLWQEKTRELDSVVDRLGYGIEPGIKEGVAGLNLLGVPTIQSCEGHVADAGEDAGHGLPFPWIQLEAPNRPEEKFVGEREAYESTAKKYGIPVEDVKHAKDMDIWREAALAMSDELTPEFEVWELENEKLSKKTQETIEEFYTSRNNPEELRLRVDYNVLHNGGEYYIEADANKEVRDFRERLSERQATEEEVQKYRELLAKRQKEMKEFNSFLKNKFINSK